jgi:hypothetical protein
VHAAVNGIILLGARRGYRPTDMDTRRVRRATVRDMPSQMAGECKAFIRTRDIKPSALDSRGLAEQSSQQVAQRACPHVIVTVFE